MGWAYGRMGIWAYGRMGYGMGYEIGMGLWDLGWDGVGLGLGYGRMGFGILPNPLVWAASIVEVAIAFHKKNAFVSARVSQCKESGLSIPSDREVSLSAESESQTGVSSSSLIKMDLEDNGGNDNMEGNYDDNTRK